MKVIVFGVGNYYREQKEKLNTFSNIEILAYTDNNTALWGEIIDGRKVIPPDSIQCFPYDQILIMSTYGFEIYHQLIGFGVDKDDIITWEKVCAREEQGRKDLYSAKQTYRDGTEKILFISTDLDYNGGSFAVVYAAMSLVKRGNSSVVLAAPSGNKDFILEIIESGISVVICHALPYLFDTEKKWVQQFDLVIVNVFQMIQCAYEVSKIRPTLWWIHEPTIWYKPIIERYPDCIDMNKLSNINIYAVSRVAQQIFNQFFIDRITKTLVVGIPDVRTNKIEKDKQTNKLVFAIIGSVEPLKAQNIFIEAASKISKIAQAEFWIIGKLSDNAYCCQINERAAELSAVKLLGKLTKKQIYDAFSVIDVVVCASQEETLSMTIIEAMMFGKVCITTETTGISDYIDHNVNGFIIPVNDSDALAAQMEWITLNIDRASELGLAARKTYERYFTMERLGKNLETAISETKRKWIKTCVDY